MKYSHLDVSELFIGEKTYSFESFWGQLSTKYIQHFYAYFENSFFIPQNDSVIHWKSHKSW